MTDYRLKRYKNENKKPRYSLMEKYEKARALGERALLIASGRSAIVDVKSETDPLKIAEMELKANVLPVVIRRYIDDEEFEDWVLDDDQHIFKDLYEV